MSTANQVFLAALSNRAAGNSNVKFNQPEKPSHPAAITPRDTVQSQIHVESDTKPVLTVDRVLNRGRLDLFFSFKPDDRVLRILNENGWHYRGKDKVWYHKDAKPQHDFLYIEFGIRISSDSDTIADDAVTTIDPTPVKSVPDVQPQELPEYEEYKRQAAALIEALKIDAADLMLIAVNHLYQKHFGHVN